MAFKTSLLKQLNGFDVALDAGAPLPGGGDLDMFYRVMRSGNKIVYAPNAVVKHRHRRSMRMLMNQLSGHQRSVIALLTKSLFKESPGARISVLIFLIWRLIKPFVRIFKRLLGKDVLPTKFLIDMIISSWAGLGSYYTSKRRTQQYRNASYGN
jgi:GT2 family glycosyltransferase